MPSAWLSNLHLFTRSLTAFKSHDHAHMQGSSIGVRSSDGYHVQGSGSLHSKASYKLQRPSASRFREHTNRPCHHRYHCSIRCGEQKVRQPRVCPMCRREIAGRTKSIETMERRHESLQLADEAGSERCIQLAHQAGDKFPDCSTAASENTLDYIRDSDR